VLGSYLKWRRLHWGEGGIDLFAFYIFHLFNLVVQTAGSSDVELRFLAECPAMDSVENHLVSSSGLDGSPFLVPG